MPAAITDADIDQDSATVKGQYDTALKALRQLRKQYGHKRPRDAMAFLRFLKVTLSRPASRTPFSHAPAVDMRADTDSDSPRDSRSPAIGRVGADA